MKNKIIFLILIINIILFTASCNTGSAETTVITKAPESTDTSLPDKILADIIKSDRSYSECNADVISEDYDKDGAKEYFYIFTKKGTTKDDYLNNLDYQADIWFGSKNGISHVAGWTYIVPDTYGSITLADKKYFRYDLSFGTESQTILLSIENDTCVEFFHAQGYADFDSNSNDFTVVSGSYDMNYVKPDGILCGHTWKPYYYYADEQGFHEYGGTKIKKEEFLGYPDAAKIIEDIKKEYDTDDNKISYRFIKRSNGLLHINITCETEEYVSYHYRTYQLGDDNKLELNDSGDGSYGEAITPEIAVQ